MAQERSQNTKAALIRAAFQLFAEKGFAATSTREIAAEAGTNIASIPYHFGSKAGLRMACAETIVDRLSQLRSNPEALDVPDIVQTAETPFEALALRQAYMLLSLEEAGPMIRFLFREAHDHTEAFDYIYQKFFNPMLDFLWLHWADALGRNKDEPETEHSRILLLTIIGQIVYFRMAQPVVARRMNWQGYSKDEALAVLTVFQSNIRAMIAMHRNVS